MGQCQSNCKRTHNGADVRALQAAKWAEEVKALRLKHTPSSIELKTAAATPLEQGEELGTSQTPATVSTISTATPRTLSHAFGTPLTDHEKTTPRSKNGLNIHRRRQTHKVEDHFPVSQTPKRKTPMQTFTPIVSSLKTTVNSAMIPEEKDPEAPSDEEEDQRQVDLERLLEEPHLRHEKKAWVQTATTGVSPLQVPPGPTLQFGKDAVHPDAMSHFQKLRLQAQVANHEAVQKVQLDGAEAEVQDVHDQRQRWQEYQNLQATVQQSSNSANGQIVEGDSEDEVAVAVGQRRRRGSKEKTQKRKSSIKRGRNQSFDLSDSDSWYFDFQAQDFDTETRKVNKQAGDDNASQSGLSLLSETSMEAQRRLFREKAKRTNKKGAKEPNQRTSDSVARGSASNATARKDYGPQRKIISTGEDESCSSVSGIEVAVPARSRAKSEDDRSCVSDLGDESMAASAVSNGLNDYGVLRRRRNPTSESDLSDSRHVVDPRFEETLKAVQQGSLEPEDKVIKSTISSRLDKLEQKLASTPLRAHFNEKDDPSLETPITSNRPASSNESSGVASTPVLNHSLGTPQDQIPVQTPTISNTKESSLMSGRFLNESPLSKVSLISEAGSDTSTDDVCGTTEPIPSGDLPSPDAVKNSSDENDEVCLKQTAVISHQHQIEGKASSPEQIIQEEEMQNTPTFDHPNTSEGNKSNESKRYSAERARVLSQLVNSRIDTPEKCYNKNTENISFSSQEDDIPKPIRESRIPVVLGVSTEEFLLSAEENIYERARLFDLGTHEKGEQQSSLSDQNEVGVEENASVGDASDASSCSDFGEIMRSTPAESNEDSNGCNCPPKKGLEPEASFGDWSLQRAEKVEAQVKTVLTNYKESSGSVDPPASHRLIDHY